MNEILKPQVASEHYRKTNYLGADRWVSYGNQVRTIIENRAKRVLEVGVGNGIVCAALQSLGLSVTTLDIDPDLKPSVVGSVTSMPFPNSSFDMVLVAEVLEHLPFEDFGSALSEICRVTERYAYITLPHAGAVFLGIKKLPLLPRLQIFFKLPFFWRVHVFNGEHYWELGKKNFPVQRILREISRAGFRVIKSGIDAQDPAHYFFLLDRSHG